MRARHEQCCVCSLHVFLCPCVRIVLSRSTGSLSTRGRRRGALIGASLGLEATPGRGGKRPASSPAPPPPCSPTASPAGATFPAARSDLSGRTRLCACSHSVILRVRVGGGVLHILLMWIKAAHVEFTVTARYYTTASPLNLFLTSTV